MHRLLVAVVVVLALADGTLASELDEAADALARRFFVAAASTDAAVREDSVSRIYSDATLAKVGRERLAAQAERIGTTFGAVKFHHVEVTSASFGGTVRYVAHVFAQQKGGEWLDFQFRLEAGPPVRFTELAFVANVTEPVALPNGEITDPATLKWLSDYVAKLADKEGLSGAILIARGDEVLFERYFGGADAKRSTHVTAETRFSLGSGNKMMTALLAARLVEQGKLSFDAKLRTLVPAFPESTNADAATLHHLLSHTSGIGEYWTKEFASSRPTLLTNADFLPWITRRGFDFAPGSDYAYSNSNFILAGLAVERLSGADYEALLRVQVFEPLGMSSSSLGIEEKGSFAQPLVRDGQGWKHSGLRGIGSAAGGAWSTPRDMLRFSRGLRAGKLVSKEMLDRMTTSKTAGLGEAEDYGYGFQLHQHGQARAYGHGGTAPGVNFDFQYFPREDVTFVIMSNQDNGAYDDLRKNAVKLISGQR